MEEFTDAWGNVLSISGMYANTLGQDNPIRYRGYYYDFETGFYYLQSRYYDPAMGRFINADGYVSTGQGILGNNMFAYCLNNPVNKSDFSGEFALTSTLFGVAIWKIGAFISGAILAIALTDVIVHNPPDFHSISIPKIDSKIKVEEKEKEAIKILPKDTIVYRYGSTSPGNLTPKEKDALTGLSFSLTPPPPGVSAAVTTIGALNSTGMLIAIHDGPNHVSVIPAPTMGTLQEWIRTGPSHPCTAAVKSVVIKWKG